MAETEEPDLHLAAPALAARVKDILAESGEAATRFATLTKQLQEMAQGVEEDWTALASAAKALGELLATSSADLETNSVPAAGGALVGIEIALGEQGTPVDAEVREACERIAWMQGGAQAVADNLPTVSTECVDTPVAALVKEAKDAEGALETLFQEATDYLDETYVPRIDEEIADVEHRSTITVSMCRYTGDLMSTAFPDWARKYAEACDLVEAGGFTAMRDHAKATVDDTRGEFDPWHRQTLDDLLKRLAQVRDALTDLAAEVRTRRFELLGPSDAFAESSAALAAAMTAANAALVRSRGVLQSHGHL